MKTMSQRAARTAWMRFRDEHVWAKDARLVGAVASYEAKCTRARAALDGYNRIARRAGDCVVAWEAP